VTRSDLRALRSAILRWYRRNRRDLPWRRSRDPYAIWVSEIMLQQTRVETVIPYYDRFLERFPTVEALAGARAEQVAAAWSGLGYYGRARSLHAAASIVAREHAGRLPDSTDALRALPGIGAYTAAAIASVAHGRPAAAVDGNVIRVLARIAGLQRRRDDPALRRAIDGMAEDLARGASPGDWTQALMELGALVCTPRAPRCESCPAAARCAARDSGDPAAYPTPARKAGAVKTRRLVMLLARRGARVLLVPDAGKSSAAWSLPSSDAATAASARQAAARLSRRWGVGPPLDPPKHRFRHRTYAEDLHVEVWETEVPKRTRGVSVDPAPPPRPPRSGATWADPARLADLPVRGPTLKALKGLVARRKTP
jgi:A/G-specific adenine glycosylase